MSTLLHALLKKAAIGNLDPRALIYRKQEVNYGKLLQICQAVGGRLLQLGLEREVRVALYLPKKVETVAGIFATRFQR